MRSSSTTSRALAIVWACFSLGCRPQAEASGAVQSASTSAQHGAIAGPVLGDSSGIRAVPLQPLRAGGDTITHLSITLMGEQAIFPPALLVIVAPDAKQTGMRRNWDSPRAEIPGAKYNAPPAPADSSDEGPLEIGPQLVVDQLVTGRYMLLISGVEPRRYILSIRAQRQRGRAFGAGEWNGQTAPGSVDTVLIDIGPGLDTAVAVAPSSFR